MSDRAASPVGDIHQGDGICAAFTVRREAGCAPREMQTARMLLNCRSRCAGESRKPIRIADEAGRAVRATACRWLDAASQRYGNISERHAHHLHREAVSDTGRARRLMRNRPVKVCGAPETADGNMCSSARTAAEKAAQSQTDMMESYHGAPE